MMQVSENPAVLSDIYDPANNIAVWRRELDQSIYSSVDLLFEQTQSLKIEGIATAETDNETLLKALDNYEGAKSLRDEINELVNMFCYLFDLRRAGLRLTMLDHAMCPRFHVDKVPCRLVTTFQGTGTEWLPHGLADRAKLGAGNNGLPDDRSGIYRHASDICHLQRGDVALLKGERWEGNENAGLVHRSPGLNEGERRLLLTLDFVD